jgi:hypothetical protein
MRTTGSASPATYNCRSEVRGPIAEVKPLAEKELPKAKALTSAIGPLTSAIGLRCLTSLLTTSKK